VGSGVGVAVGIIVGEAVAEGIIVAVGAGVDGDPQEISKKVSTNKGGKRFIKASYLVVFFFVQPGLTPRLGAEFLVQLADGGFVIAGMAEENAERSVNGLHSGLTDGNGLGFE
jgi:hypothetical protein